MTNRKILNTTIFIFICLGLSLIILEPVSLKINGTIIPLCQIAGGILLTTSAILHLSKKWIYYDN